MRAARAGCYALLLLLAGCVTAPAHVAVDQQASGYGFVRSQLAGARYDHVIYESNARREGGKLHVYIEGDGVPWRYRYHVASDPTPRRPLMLKLMGLDPENTLYLGRPCYFGLANTKNCSPDVWTYSRYSAHVVSSMASVIRQRAQLMQPAAAGEIVLFGHSGGGALALLLAEQLKSVTTVVTVAGNIDVDAWVRHHDYTPLYGSLNPARRRPLPIEIRQLHLVGGSDTNVRPEMVLDWIEQQPAATLWRYADYTHLCCWNNVWSEVLRWVDSESLLAGQQTPGEIGNYTVYADIE